jgi:type I restriction enzyme, S subunit
MIDDLKPYPAMKDSGVPWLRKVPKHWDVLPTRALFVEVKDREHPEEDMLSVTITKGVVRQTALLAESAKKDNSNLDRSAYKLVQPNDIAYNKMRAWQGAIGASSLRGIVSPAYVVMRPRDTSSAQYFHQLLRTPMFAKEAERWSYGITSDMWSLRPEHFKLIYVVVPPPKERTLIVKFLAHADARIHRYIRAKQKLIELLEEQQQVIIHQAVTRGLDQDVHLKPSGVEWLGEVPEHWKILPLRRVTIARCDGPFGSGLKSSHYTSNGIRVIRLQNIGRGAFRDADAAFIASAYYATLGDHSVETGDVLVAGLGDERHPAGRACVAPASIVPAMVKADCFRFRLDLRRVNSDFVALHLTATAVAASAILSTGATRQRTNLQSTASRAIGVPPLCEQEAIVAAISSETASLSIAIDRASREISLLREYRTRLIADVVTGKLDVREAAAKLPDEPEEIEELDTAEELEAVEDTSGDVAPDDEKEDEAA